MTQFVIIYLSTVCHIIFDTILANALFTYYFYNNYISNAYKIAGI